MPAPLFTQLSNFMNAQKRRLCENNSIRSELHYKAAVVAIKMTPLSAVVASCIKWRDIHILCNVLFNVIRQTYDSMVAKFYIKH